MRREEHILEAVSAKNDRIASSELVDTVEDLIPGVLGHETDERVQTNHRLLIEMVENGRCESIDMVMLTPYWINILN
jgi:hypothetical protein